MPKRPYQEDNELPITPDAISPDDNSRSSSGSLPIDNVASTSTSSPLVGFNVPDSSTSLPRFNFAPSAPPMHQAASGGYSLAGAQQPESSIGASTWPAHQNTTYNENRFEVQQVEAELNESSEQGNEQDNTLGQVDGELPMEEQDWYEEPEDNSSYLKNVLMVMDFRDAETDDAHFD